MYLVGGITMAMSLLGAYGAHGGKRIPLIVVRGSTATS